MVCFPNAKINLGLNVIRRRSDGYHDIESIFYPLELCDVLEVIPARERSPGDAKLYLYGLPVQGDAASNLCMKAYRLLQNDFSLPAADLHLYKKIPAGSGLGGGSSDGTHAIKLLNDLFDLKLANGQMADYARKLGSDCAFFIFNSPVLATGKGDEFEDIILSLEGYRIELAFPGVHVSTAQAYKGIKPSRPPQPVKEIIKLPPEEWKDRLKNDFEESVFLKFPQVKKAKEEMYRKGAVYASMSGSGSAVYGLFRRS